MLMCLLLAYWLFSPLFSHTVGAKKPEIKCAILVLVKSLEFVSCYDMAKGAQFKLICNKTLLKVTIKVNLSTSTS